MRSTQMHARAGGAARPAASTAGEPQGGPPPWWHGLFVRGGRVGSSRAERRARVALRAAGGGIRVTNFREEDQENLALQARVCVCVCACVLACMRAYVCTCVRIWCNLSD